MFITSSANVRSRTTKQRNLFILQIILFIISGPEIMNIGKQIYLNNRNSIQYYPGKKITQNK